MHILAIFNFKVMLALLKSCKIIASYILHAASPKEIQISPVFLLISYWGFHDPIQDAILHLTIFFFLLSFPQPLVILFCLSWFWHFPRISKQLFCRTPLKLYLSNVLPWSNPLSPSYQGFQDITVLQRWC